MPKKRNKKISNLKKNHNRAHSKISGKDKRKINVNKIFKISFNLASNLLKNNFKKNRNL